MSYIDLSHSLTESTPVYPGDPNVNIEEAASLSKDGYLDHTISFGTHNGTHMDAPAHMVEGGKMLSDFGPDTFIGKGLVLDVRSGFDLRVIEDSQIDEGMIIFFCTGMAKKYLDEDYYTSYPAIPVEVAEYLVASKVKMVGVDSGSVDHEPFPIHKELLSHDVLIVENLCNLTPLLNWELEIIALPLKLEVEGAPARVLARKIRSLQG
jgi:kynurenine formamidase